MTEQEATEKAKELVSKLKGKWDIRVWNNLGWHYSANLVGGSISVYEDYSTTEKPRYHAMVGGTLGKYGGMPYHWSVEKDSFDNPQEAVDMYLSHIKGILEDELNVIQTNIDLVHNKGK